MPRFLIAPNGAGDSRTLIGKLAWRLGLILRNGTQTIAKARFAAPLRIGLFRVGGEFALVGMVIRGRRAAKEHPENIRGIDLTDSARLVGELIGNRLARSQSGQG